MLAVLQNTPLHPIAEWGRQRFGGADIPAKQRLADLESTLTQVKLDTAESAPLLAPLLDIPLPLERSLELVPEELRRRQLAAVTNLIIAGARTQPIVLAVEDAHWADPSTLDLLRGIAERGALAPLLLLITGRPEFRPAWGMRSHHSLIALAPLDRDQVRHMVGELAARHALPKEVVEGVTDRTGGVPLFVEELTRLLLEQGGHSGAKNIPPTLQQSLAARLDRLGSAREVAQIGAVIGRDFSYALLRIVAGMDDAPVQLALDRSPKRTSCSCRASLLTRTTVSSTRSFRTQLTRTCSRAGGRLCTAAPPRRYTTTSLRVAQPCRSCWRTILRRRV